MASREKVRAKRPLSARERRDRRIALFVGVAGAVVFAVLGIAGLVATFASMSVADATPRATPTPIGEPLYVDPDSHAARHAVEDERLLPLAETPQAKWFGGWSTVASAAEDVEEYLKGAAESGEVPVMVIYQIPGRDCGSFSAGGLRDADEYRGWVEAAAEVLVHYPGSIVIMEPDALLMADRCTDEAERTGLIADAVRRLSASGARVYIDAAHSGFREIDVMVRRLLDAGIADATGFATNVSNYRPTADEIAYAERLVQRLVDEGVEDPHYVIDVSRNGALLSSEEWCNPPDARVGQYPSLYTGTPLDALLWIKRPGETDGACNGGPAGGFWVEGALSLLDIGQ